MSPCSALTPDALVRAAMARGFDGVCITEHDALWTAADIARVADEMQFPVLRGMEVTTEVGHVLVFGMELMGAKDVSNYYPSWAEWGNDPDTPVVPGNAQQKKAS